MDPAQQGESERGLTQACSSKFGGALAGDLDVDGERCSSMGGENPPHDHQYQHASGHPYRHQQHRRHNQSKGQQQQQQQQQQGGFIRGADRRTLQNVRVIRRTLVYAIGLSPNFSQVNTLKQPEYFGQYGEITKLVINHHHGVAPDDPRHGSASAYITFRRSEDAWAAICSVDGFRILGRTIRASFGTTKYCNSFLRNLPCNNPDCLYLHELGDEDDRFTKDEVQLGLARHGSSFAFKEEVLGKSADATRPQPTNPVFPPPCAMPPASYQRDGAARHGKEGGPHHQHHHNNNHPNGACGHAHPPACAIHGGGGGGYNGGASNGADLRWMAAPTEPGSPLPLGGGGGDDRPRLRRRRGQRGRRGSGAGDHSCDGRGTIGGGGGPGTVQEPHGGGGGVYRALSSVPNLDRFYDMGGLANGNLYRPLPKPTPGFGGSDRSTGSSGGSSWGNGCGSPSATAETLSSTPPLELSKLEGFSPTSTSASFFRGGGSGSISNGTAPPPRDVWNQGHFHRHPRPSPSSFSGVAAADAETQRGFLDQHRQLQQQHLLEQQQLLQLLQLQRQQQQLFQQGGGRDGVGVSGGGVGGGGGGGVRSQDLLPNLAARQGLNQPRLGEGSGERATIAVLQQQVQQLQRYFETLEGGLPLPPPSLGSGLGEGSSNAVPAPTTGGESSFSDDLSAAEERLAALSWDDDDARTFSQQLGGPGGGEAADFASRRGGADARDGSSETSFWATESAPLVGFGSFAQTSAASQAEASEWRRATPRLFA